MQAKLEDHETRIVNLEKDKIRMIGDIKYLKEDRIELKETLSKNTTAINDLVKTNIEMVGMMKLINLRLSNEEKETETRQETSKELVMHGVKQMITWAGRILGALIAIGFIAYVASIK